MNITNLTTIQLQQIIAIKEQIEGLESQIESIAAGGGDIPSPFPQEAPAPAKRKLSAAHRRKLIKALAKARKIRWAKMKGMPKKGKRRLSAAGRAAISAAAKARWARVRGPAATAKAKKKDWRSSPAVRAKLSAAAKARWAKARAEGRKTL
jgi:hypothetical protein